MVAVSTPFPLSPQGQLGYDSTEVDAFLARARSAYAAAPGEGGLTSADIRRTAFAMTKSGYSTGHVDAALERLEDAFAERERERARRQAGDDEWYGGARQTAEEIVARLDRPEGHRFDRVGFLTAGYHPRDVDRLVRRLQGYFSDGRALSIDDVRGSVFRAKRGGYREAQVDVVLDAVVDVMLAVR
ncbi:DivIVA domain-containing protein [Frigoribacterium sp. PhB160]|uniref:DivIVA domain-containing protein n=1 Tax=Frigoribacterium sp. PhB160 TaxID=2485192 RepID=UPI000F463445|nr:DivIVA domain-containing protein [Frigoribacterium sp. PhB160]